VAITIPNLGLVVWNAPTDPYVSAQLAENWYRVDEHDHSPGRGRALTGLSFEEGGVSTAYLVDGAVTTPKLADGAATSSKLATGSVTVNKAAVGANGFAAGCFSAYRTNPVSSVLGGTAIGMDTKEFDLSGWYDTSQYRFLPLLSGYYRLTVLISLATVLHDTRWSTYIAKNGADFKQLDTQYAPAADNQQMKLGGSVIVYADGATDYFTIGLGSTDATPRALTTGAQYTYFQGELIGLA
jgi:hypothetical protein